MNEDHKKRTVTCQQCSGTYCSVCDSDCPSCCIHRHCQTQLVDEKGITDTAIREMERAQEELLVAKRNAESWQEAAQQAQIRADENYWLYVGLRHELDKALVAAETAVELGQQTQKELASLQEYKFGLYDTIEGLEGERDILWAERDALVAEIGLWVEAYGPDLVAYPSKEEIRAVNDTPEFRIGRNATMQVVSEGLQAVLEAPTEAQNKLTEM